MPVHSQAPVATQIHKLTTLWRQVRVHTSLLVCCPQCIYYFNLECTAPDFHSLPVFSYLNTVHASGPYLNAIMKVAQRVDCSMCAAHCQKWDVVSIRIQNLRIFELLVH